MPQIDREELTESTEDDEVQGQDKKKLKRYCTLGSSEFDRTQVWGEERTHPARQTIDILGKDAK